MLPPSFLVIHYTSRSCQDDFAELTGREELHNPLLEVDNFDVVTWRDNTALVESSIARISICGRVGGADKTRRLHTDHSIAPRSFRRDDRPLLQTRRYNL